jgi:hypothetical protein
MKHRALPKVSPAARGPLLTVLGLGLLLAGVYVLLGLGVTLLAAGAALGALGLWADLG